MVFSGRSHPELASADRRARSASSSATSSSRRSRTTRRTRATSESIRGADVFLVQTGCTPVDKNLMELMLMIQAAKLASAKRITAVDAALPVRAPGPQGEAARADLRAPRRRHAPARRRRPRADDGPARRPDPGLLHDPRRPHDGAAALRAPLPRPRAHRPRHRVGRARRGPREDGGALRRDDRGRVRDHAQDAAVSRRGRSDGDHGPRQATRSRSSATT